MSSEWVSTLMAVLIILIIVGCLFFSGFYVGYSYTMSLTGPVDINCASGPANSRYIVTDRITGESLFCDIRYIESGEPR